MRISLLTYLALAVPACTAFNVTLFATKDCTGDKLKSLGEMKASDGCTKIEGDINGSIMIDWSTENDNAEVFAFHYGEKCCVASFIRGLMWQDECMEIYGGAGSIRVVNPDDVEKGGKDQDYMREK